MASYVSSFLSDINADPAESDPEGHTPEKVSRTLGRVICLQCQLFNGKNVERGFFFFFLFLNYDIAVLLRCGRRR